MSHKRCPVVSDPKHKTYYIMNIFRISLPKPLYMFLYLISFGECIRDLPVVKLQIVENDIAVFNRFKFVQKVRWKVDLFVKIVIIIALKGSFVLLECVEVGSFEIT